ncbi:LysR family transcriptional regulator [Virgibacillus halophilus]|uniref:LysR family transcriptional regulator n=1 Tax=Tigheibacillus halophilus TaxID=361280 RepID=UPI003633CA8A
MELKQLRYFKTIVEAGNISRAAEMLYMAQPPLSQQLKRLEKELGATLIYRHTRKWELTQAGEALYRHATAMLQKQADIQEEIKEIACGTKGELECGVSSSCISLLPDKVKACRELYPDIYIKIWEGDSSYLEELLTAGDIEMALMLLPIELGKYRFLALRQEPFVVVAPKTWQAQFPNSVIKAEQIVQHPFLMLAPMEGYAVYENIIHTFHKNKLSPKVVMECKDISTLLLLVATGTGISIVPKSELNQAYHHDIVAYELEGLSINVQPSIVWLKNHRLSNTARRFIDLFGDKSDIQK